jgi:hypothetical protein
MPSGTIWGSFSGKSTSVARPYINWSYTQNTAANQSTITATLVFVRYDGYRTYDNDGQTFTITIDGTPTSQNAAFSMGPNGATDTLFSASKTVTHSDAGEKSVTISASGNTGLVGTISLSATITLTDIPRASGFTAFTLSNTVLNKDTAVTMNYTLDRQSTSFSQDMTLKIGSTVIETWNTTGTGALTRTLTAADVNTIITKVPNATSGTLTLTMQTKNGTSNVGSAKSINEGFSLNSAIAPTASGLTASIYGTGRDKTLNKYVQNISKVTASFTATAGYGATESTHTIIVRRQSDDANSQTITGESGTTANVVTLSGVYEIIATAKDSRGRTATQTITITVDAYSSPSISNFTTVRSSSVTSTVNASISSSWSPLGTSNPASVTIVGVDNIGTSQTLYTLTNSTATGLNTTQAYTGQSDASSFTYTMTITDSFGKKATAVATVGTSFVELTIAKGIGIGVGKVHERGALDVKGDSYTSGEHTIEGFVRAKAGFVPNRIYAGDNLNNYTMSGFFYSPSTADAGSIANVPYACAFSLLVEMHAGCRQTFTQYFSNDSARTWVRNMYSGTWGGWMEVSQMVSWGANNNGRFIKYTNNIMICSVNGSGSISVSSAYGSLYQNSIRWTYPAAFASDPAVSVGKALWGTGASWGTAAAITETYTDIRAIDAYNRATGTVAFSAMAMGAWR